MLQYKGYNLGCEPSEEVPTNETFGAANTRFLRHVQECSVTFPVIHYFMHHHHLQNNHLITFLNQHIVGIVLRCLTLDKRTRYEWCLAVTQDRPAKIQQAFLQHVEDIYQSLHHEIPREEVTAELTHLWQSLQLAPCNVQTISSEDVVATLDLFHPQEDVQNFRSMVQGRAWFPPSFFSILFVVWHQPNAFPWTILPHTLTNHKKKNILDHLKSPPPTVSAPVWNAILDDIPTDPLPGACSFTHHVLGKDHPAANAMFLTRCLPNWQECWTRNSWPMRRSITRKLKQWRTPPKTSELVTMVQTLYSS